MKLTIKPLSLWLAYDIKRPMLVQKMLPPELKLTSVPILEEDTRITPKLLFNAYDLSSLWMKGCRVEIQTIAKHREKGTVHFVILECLSNVNQWDPKMGLTGPNANCFKKHSKTTYRLNIEKRPERHSNIPRTLQINGTFSTKDTNISPRFAVDCNYECYFGDHPMAFPLQFDKKQVTKPVNVLRRLRIRNNLWSDVRSSTCTHAFVHKSPMIYTVDVPGMWYDVM